MVGCVMCSFVVCCSLSVVLLCVGCCLRFVDCFLVVAG